MSGVRGRKPGQTRSHILCPEKKLSSSTSWPQITTWERDPDLHSRPRPWRSSTVFMFILSGTLRLNTWSSRHICFSDTSGRLRKHWNKNTILNYVSPGNCPGLPAGVSELHQGDRGDQRRGLDHGPHLDPQHLHREREGELSEANHPGLLICADQSPGRGCLPLQGENFAGLWHGSSEVSPRYSELHHEIGELWV